MELELEHETKLVDADPNYVPLYFSLIPPPLLLLLLSYKGESNTFQSRSN